MKKLILALLALTFAVNAGAQMFRGFSFDVSYANDGSRSGGNRALDSETYGVALSPQLGWFVNDKLAIGARASFNMKQTNSNSSSALDQLLDDSNNVASVDRSIGWDIAPFAAYNLFNIGKKERLGVWAEAHAYFGVNYPRDYNYFKHQYNYGVQVVPVVSFKINEKTMFLAHFAILSVGYAGTSTVYDNRTDFSNTALLFTGKITGLLRSAFATGLYGIKLGMCTKF